MQPPTSKVVSLAVLKAESPLLPFLSIRRNVLFIWRHQYRESVAGTLHFHSYSNLSMSLIKSGVLKPLKLLLTIENVFVIIIYTSSRSYVRVSVFVDLLYVW